MPDIHSTYMRACLINDSLLDNIPAKMEQLGLSQEGGAALSTSKSLTSFGEETFGSDSDMNRQDIASGGVAPIVARESVFKYHMSKKEKEVCPILDWFWDIYVDSTLFL